MSDWPFRDPLDVVAFSAALLEYHETTGTLIGFRQNNQTWHAQFITADGNFMELEGRVAKAREWLAKRGQLENHPVW